MTERPPVTSRPRVVVDVATTGLRPVLARPSLPSYLGRIWRRRHFVLADARAQVATTSRSTLLGSAWLVINPLLHGAVYFVLFGLVLQADRGIENYLGYLVIGVFLFQWTIHCLTQGSRAVTGNRALIRSFTFPRAALPLAVVIRQTIRFLPALATMLALIVLLPPLLGAIDPGGDPVVLRVTWLWLLLPVPLVLQLLLNTGLALLAARATARVPDLTQLFQLVARFWLYASAVFFSIDRFAAWPVLHTVMSVNPMFLVLDVVRDLLLYATVPAWETWALLAGWSVGLVVVGLVVFWSGEESYGSA
ncbi:ABC transporter permease [Litorihabitans aurantiacus]|uniref:Transport permease protein n=1 Tax=Litorihabitans aurantiacus TaxID=1930061 RepID=A0AA37XGA6_9MICO|nr:ABC transporter permease [Litorihabitans aurantiacus]GMA32702.1 transport permease protein [Litorihabitans aurantiacus]